MSTCPTCGREIDNAYDEEREVARLRDWCEERGYRVTWDDQVSVRVAAEILGKSPITLKNWRYKHRGPKYYKRGSSHVSYPLAGLVDYL